MDRREALKVMGGAAAMCLLGSPDFLTELPITEFQEVTQECPRRLRHIFGEGSTITQPRLINGDDILGDWKPCKKPNLNFSAALSDNLHYPLPPYTNCLSRSNLVFILPKDAFTIIENDQTVKVCGVVKMTQLRWCDAQVTGVEVTDRTWRLV